MTLFLTQEETILLNRLQYLFQINHPDIILSISATYIGKPEIKAKIPPMLGEEAALKRLENDQKRIF